jgi:signal transduction histidine kinase
MVTALELYCDLLEEPGVLTAQFAHYASELRLVAAASRGLVEKLVALELPEGGEDIVSRPGTVRPYPMAASGERRKRQPNTIPSEPIESLEAEVRATLNLLSALAGPAIAVSLDTQGGALPVHLTREDLTRILVNLVKNASESMGAGSMAAGGRVAVGLDEFHSGSGPASWLVLTVEDNGPGIPKESLGRIFEPGYTTRNGQGSNSQGTNGRGTNGQGRAGRSTARRGLGLSITRGIVEAAGGGIHLASRPGPGARFEIELPVRAR